MTNRSVLGLSIPTDLDADDIEVLEHALGADLSTRGGQESFDAQVAAVQRLINDKARLAVQETVTSMLHPEFVTEWREPDGSIWKTIHQLKSDADARAARALRLAAATIRSSPDAAEQYLRGMAEILEDSYPVVSPS